MCFFTRHYSFVRIILTVCMNRRLEYLMLHSYIIFKIKCINSKSFLHYYNKLQLIQIKCSRLINVLYCSRVAETCMSCESGNDFMNSDEYIFMYIRLSPRCRRVCDSINVCCEDFPGQKASQSDRDPAGYLSAFRHVLEVGGGADLGLYVLQVGQRLIEHLQLPLGGGRRLGRGPDDRHLLLLEDAEGLWRVAAGRARAGRAAGVGGGRAGRDGGGAGGGGAAADGSGTCRLRTLRRETRLWLYYDDEEGQEGRGET